MKVEQCLVIAMKRDRLCVINDDGVYDDESSFHSCHISFITGQAIQTKIWLRGLTVYVGVKSINLYVNGNSIPHLIHHPPTTILMKWLPVIQFYSFDTNPKQKKKVDSHHWRISPSWIRTTCLDYLYWNAHSPCSADATHRRLHRRSHSASASSAAIRWTSSWQIVYLMYALYRKIIKYDWHSVLVEMIHGSIINY